MESSHSWEPYKEVLTLIRVGEGGGGGTGVIFQDVPPPRTVWNSQKILPFKGCMSYSEGVMQFSIVKISVILKSKAYIFFLIFFSYYINALGFPKTGFFFHDTE